MEHQISMKYRDACSTSPGVEDFPAFLWKLLANARSFVHSELTCNLDVTVVSGLGAYHFLDRKCTVGK